MARFDGVRRIFRLSPNAAAAERDVDAEIEFHIETRVEALVASGVPRDEARTRALREFGDLPDARTELRAMARRRAGRVGRAEWWEALEQDSRFAVRTFAAHRGFTIAAVLTLSLGIGAATSMLAVVDGVLLRPLPYPNAGRVVLLWTTMRADGGGSEQPFSAANFNDLRDQARSFEAMAAFRSWGFTVGDAEGAELLRGARVSPSLFRVLGTRALLGRALEAGDDLPGAPAVVVLGHAVWRRRFGADPGIVGRTISLNGDRVTVVGVMPPGFTFPRGAELPSGFQFPPRSEIWTPLVVSPERLRQRGTFDLAVAALLRPGVTPERASAEIDPIMTRIGAENGMRQFGIGAKTIAMRDQSTRGVRAGLLLLLGAVGLVLLIACANVSNLLVARTSGRRRELAVRAALGAGRGRLVRQLVTENLLLALAGGLLGVALAAMAKDSLLALAPADLPRLDDVRIDGRVVALTLLIVLIAGSAFGLAVAAQGARAGIAGVLREGGRSGSGGLGRSRLRTALVVAEVALSMVLLVGAALLARSFVRAERVAPGFAADGAVTASLVLPARPELGFSEQGPGWRDRTERYLASLRALPGVVAAGAVSSLPLTGAWESTTFGIVGKQPPPGERFQAQYATASAGYFRAMGIPMVRGRAFDESDRADAEPVAMLSRAAAEKFFPGEDPVGQALIMFDRAPRRIIGVAGDVRQLAVTDPTSPTIYIPSTQFPYPFVSVVVRAAGEPGALVRVMRRELARIDPTAALTEARPLREVLDASLAQRRFGMLLVIFFAVSALVLAAVGLYGVIAYAVSQRTHEIGVRMALGALPSDVLRLVLRQALVLGGAGLALGLLGALAASSLLTRQLFEVSVVDPATYAGIAALLLGVALLASWLPARRATRVDPVTALRET